MMGPNSTIKNIEGKEILDSRGNPTVEVRVESDRGVFRASVPSGASRGKYEAVELRDGGKRFEGKGVLKAVANINKIIAQELRGRDPSKQEKIDELMIKLDGTKNKSRLGANAILPVSIAVCRAGAAVKNLPLFEYISQIAGTKPLLATPSVLCVEGGLHAGNKLDFQEFMLLPLTASSFKEKFSQTKEVYHKLKGIIKKRFGEKLVRLGYEGGFAIPLSESEQVLELIIEALKEAGYEDKIKISLDVAASSFFQNRLYRLHGKTFTKEELLDFYSSLICKYPIASIEDPFAEEDWEGFRRITEKFGKKVIIIGDDLLVTNIIRIKKAIKEKACNGLILKPNQIGTVTETIGAAKLAKSAGWKIMVAHRAGDTCDDFIADLAVGIGAEFIKAGGPTKKERLAKYNRLLEIESLLKAKKGV